MQIITPSLILLLLSNVTVPSVQWIWCKMWYSHIIYELQIQMHVEVSWYDDTIPNLAWVVWGKTSKHYFNRRHQTVFLIPNIKLFYSIKTKQKHTIINTVVWLHPQSHHDSATIVSNSGKTPTHYQ